MRRLYLALVIALLAGAFAARPAVAQKSGGVLRVYAQDSQASMSIHEEATPIVVQHVMGVFNNLVMYDQHIAQNSLSDIVPDLATGWSWDAAGTALTFKLRHGVKWHDGVPFTAADVKCTWDMLTGRSDQKFRANPRKSWYWNLKEVTTNGDDEVTFHLSQPQPAFIALLASGWSPVYPCHIPPAQMRQHPIGTGPFKFVEYKPGEDVRLVRNPDYWKPGRPYLDGIDFTIIPDRSTAMLAFVAGRFDMTFPYLLSIPLMKDLKSQMPAAECTLAPLNSSVNLIVNRDKPPFDNADLRRAMALTLDRKSFMDILAEGQGFVGGAMLPPPVGIWGMPKEMLEKLPGYDPDITKNRDAARAIMQKLGYGPDKHLSIKVSTRNLGPFKDPAVILIDQLKQIYIDADLEVIETANWFPKIVRKDYAVGLNLTAGGVDDPDQQFFENYACGSERNYTGYCNRDIEKLFSEQSQMNDQDARKKLVWDIDKKLQEDGARPIIYHWQGGTCWRPEVKGVTVMVNSAANGWRWEDVWLDR
jgi:peptide/nickel transport system substrate-binding protein